MSTTETKAPAKEAKGEAKLQSGLVHNDPYASFVSPDLSFTDGIDLDDERQAWADERDEAREEGVKAAAEHDAKIAKLRTEAQEEASEQAAKAREEQAKRQVDAGIVPAATPTAEQVLSDKLGGSKKS
jgi:hypothetical protein